jgi:hypothetical protein
VLHKLRQQDESLMELAIKAGHPRSELECLNACRLYLQVTSLAEISSDTGDTILPQAYGALQKNKRPQLWLISQSHLQ